MPKVEKKMPLIFSLLSFEVDKNSYIDHLKDNSCKTDKSYCNFKQTHH